MQITPRQVLEEHEDLLWRMFPHTFAQVASNGVWVPYRHLAYVSKIIAPLILKGNARIIISMPPRHGKSEFASFWVPAWLLDLAPQIRILMASYEADFASSWGRKVRNFFESQRGSELSQVRIKDDSHAANRWETTEGGGMATAGIGGAFTGKGGDLLLIDDPTKNWVDAMSPGHHRKNEEWFNSTFYTRREPGASIIVIMTRWVENDLAGYLQTKHDDDWTVIRLPALAEENDPLGRAVGAALCPERYNIDDLAKIRKSIGVVMWSGLFAQEPTNPEGGIFKKNWFRHWTHDGVNKLPEKFDEVIQSWDLPFDKENIDTASFASGQVWGRKGAMYYLLWEFHEQVDFNDAEKAIIRMHVEWPRAIRKLIENKAMGAPIISRLKKKVPGLKPWNPRGSKEARAIAVSPLLESGNVLFPHPDIHPWSNQFADEIAAFPRAKLKDRVDAMVQALQHFSKKGLGTGKMNLDQETRPSYAMQL